jgi:hypothetical protein
VDSGFYAPLAAFAGRGRLGLVWSGEPRRSAGLETDQKVPRRGSLLRLFFPSDGNGRAWTDKGRYRWWWQRNIIETAEVAALMVLVAIAVFFGMLSVCRCVPHQLASASIMVDCTAADVQGRLDRPHQQQDSGHHPQQPRQRRSCRKGCGASHPSLWKKHADVALASGFPAPR